MDRPPIPYDSVLLQPTRLAIVGFLVCQGATSFSKLAAALGISDGALSAHNRILEDANYIEQRKEFVDGRRPRTLLLATRKGRAALLKLQGALASIVGEAAA